MPNVLISVVQFPEENAYGVVINASGERLKGTYYYDPNKGEDDRIKAQLMAGAYATGYADCKWPDR